MNKKTIRDIAISGKKVLMRVDFNVPLKNGEVADDTRITAALPTIKYCIEQGAAVILMSHLGRPKGGRSELEFSLRPVGSYLSGLLKQEVLFAPDCIGAEAVQLAQALKPGQVLLLENVRFYKEEEGKAKTAEGASEDEVKAAKAEMKKKQLEFAEKLSKLGDLYVNDAFGTAHRAHGSTAVITKFFKDNVAGFLMEKELAYLGSALANPERPFLAILGGAKVSDKVSVIENLLNKVNSLIIGGAMAYTFYQAKGLPTGSSLVEADKVELARGLLKQAEEKGVKLLLPIDHVIADKFAADAAHEVVAESGIRDGWMALDIGPKTIELFNQEISRSKTILWNGPVGAFEMAPFAEGTMSIALAIARTKCTSIIGGGDSVSAVNKSGVAADMTHISTGGGASLEFLEGKVLPGVAALNDK